MFVKGLWLIEALDCNNHRQTFDLLFHFVMWCSFKQKNRHILTELSYLFPSVTLILNMANHLAQAWYHPIWLCAREPDSYWSIAHWDRKQNCPHCQAHGQLRECLYWKCQCHSKNRILNHWKCLLIHRPEVEEILQSNTPHWICR